MLKTFEALCFFGVFLGSCFAFIGGFLGAFIGGLWLASKVPGTDTI